MPSLNTGNAILSNAIAVNSSYNVGIGGAASGSLKLQVTGSDILVNGLTIGEGAGSIASNTVLGASALPVNTTGTLNTAIGNSALLTNTTGYGNTSVGYSAIGYNTTGFFNAGVGVNALLSNTTGTYNNALGTAALYANTTGSYNTAVGQQAGTANTTGSNNTYIGYSSGLNITTGSNNTIIGNFAGTSALANNIVLADGAGNVRYQWDGTNNVFTGAATFSNQVTINGPSADWAAIIQNTNSGAGTSYGLKVKAGTSGAADATFVLQDYAGNEFLTARGNGRIGIGTSSPNTILDVNGTINVRTNGYEFGRITTNNISGTTGGLTFQYNSAGTFTNGIIMTGGGQVGINTIDGGVQLSVKSVSTTTSSYPFMCFDSANTAIFYIRSDSYGFINTSAWAYGSDRRIKENISYLTESGLEKILKLKPARFDYIDGNKNNIGWIAQDVQEVIEEAVNISNEKTGMLALKSDFIVPYLVKAIQELNQKVNEQQQTINSLINR